MVSSDQSIPHLDLKNVKHPREVKEMIHRSVEAAKDRRRMRTMEVMGGESDGAEYHDTDLDDDILDE